MIHEILTASGIPYRQARFLNPPAETYAVYLDDHDTTPGPDPVPGAVQLIRHDIMVEIYEPKPDAAAEAAMEAALMAAGLYYTKQDRYWLQNVQRYQVVYEFHYIEKRRA